MRYIAVLPFVRGCTCYRKTGLRRTAKSLRHTQHTEGEGTMAEKSEQDINREVEQRLQEIELLREEAQQQRLRFASLSEEELMKRIRGESSESPYFYAAAWTGGLLDGTPRGTAINYTAYIGNPDPTPYYPVFMSIFFGAASFVNDIGEALSGKDTRLPYPSTPPFSLAALANVTKTITFAIPTNVPPSTYIGNTILWRGDFFRNNAVLDRCFFDVVAV